MLSRRAWYKVYVCAAMPRMKHVAHRASSELENHQVRSQFCKLLYLLTVVRIDLSCCVSSMQMKKAVQLLQLLPLEQLLANRTL